MYPIEREKEILRLLDLEGKASVEQLADLTGASEMTVRRDLERLESRGQIVRTHGGAVKRDFAAESPFTKRDNEMSREKSALASAAAERIPEGSAVFLDSSTTAMRIVPFLADKDVTVITNGLMTAVECGRYSIRTVCTGGTLNGLSYTFTGIEALRAAERYRADFFVFSCRGTDKNGIYDSTAEICAVKEAMAASAKKSILLVDSSKLGAGGRVRLDCKPDAVITDGEGVFPKSEVIRL